MKKIITFAFCVLLATVVFAQDSPQGDDNQSTNTPEMWLGGGATFGNLSGRDFTVAPNFGILLRDNMGLGGIIYLSSGNNSNAWSLEPYLRYYMPIADNVSFYGDAFIGIGGGDNLTGTDGGEYNTLDFGARAGIQYWFTSRWSMTASNNVLVYNSVDGSGDFGVGLNFASFNFAFFFHF